MKNITELISQKSNIRICAHIVSRPLSLDVSLARRNMSNISEDKILYELGCFIRLV